MSYGQKGWEVQNVVLSERMQLRLRMTPQVTKLFFHVLAFYLNYKNIIPIFNGKVDG